MIVPLDDPDDPRLEPFRDIRERDIVGRGGLIAEGAVVLDQLLASTRFRPTALLVLRNRLEGLRSLLATLDPAVPVYVAERAVIDRIAGFAMHRGVLAHAEAVPDRSVPTLKDLADRGAPLVAAIGIANHDNMGAIFRNAAAFGAGAVLLDATSCDPLYRKAIRVSVGTTLTLPFTRFADPLALVDELGSAGFDCVALAPRSKRELHDWRPERPVALFLGAEGPGLPPELAAQMTGLSIRMAPGIDSLNVATAAAIALHHLAAFAPAPR